jgi:transcriptional antiterminator RfaH
MSTHWYVIATKPRQESAAETQLARQGFNVFLPQIALRKRRRGRWADVVEPLFPGYAFVEMDVDSQSTAPIRSTVGVTGLVRFGGELLAVPEAVMAIVLSAGQLPPEGVCAESALKPGDAVQVVGGPFAGLAGVFTLSKGADRVAVLLNLLGRETEVVVAEDDVAPV